MPDVTIPVALLVTLGVIICAVFAVRSGDYRVSTLAGVVGTLFNLLCFYRRLAVQARTERRRSRPPDASGHPAEKVN